MLSLGDQMGRATALRVFADGLALDLRSVRTKGIGSVRHCEMQPVIATGGIPLTPDAHDAVLKVVEADLAQQLAAAEAEYAAFTVTTSECS